MKPKTTRMQQSALTDEALWAELKGELLIYGREIKTLPAFKEALANKESIANIISNFEARLCLVCLITQVRAMLG